MSRKPRPQSTKPTAPAQVTSPRAPGAGRRAAGIAVAAGAASRSRVRGPFPAACWRRTRRSRRRSAGISRRRSTSPRSRTWSRWRPTATRAGTRSSGRSRPPTSVSCRSASTPPCRPTRAGIRSTAFPRPRSTTARSSTRRATGCAASCRTRTSASRSRRRRSPSNELRDVYTAALGYDVSATNLKRVLLRRGALVPTGGRRDSGPCRRPSGGGVRASPSRRSRSPIRSPPCGRRTCAAPWAG